MEATTFRTPIAANQLKSETNSPHRKYISTNFISFQWFLRGTWTSCFWESRLIRRMCWFAGISTARAQAMTVSVVDSRTFWLVPTWNSTSTNLHGAQSLGYSRDIRSRPRIINSHRRQPLCFGSQTGDCFTRHQSCKAWSHSPNLPKSEEFQCERIRISTAAFSSVHRPSQYSRGIFITTTRSRHCRTERSLPTENQNVSSIQFDFSLAFGGGKRSKTQSTEIGKNLAPHQEWSWPTQLQSVLSSSEHPHKQFAEETLLRYTGLLYQCQTTLENCEQFTPSKLN